MNSMPADEVRISAMDTSPAPTLLVSEIFGPTFQGEGPTTGRRCGFVRLGRCDLACRWCDTPYTWDWQGKNGVRFDPGTELTRRDIEGILDEIEPMEVDRVVVTGGEPLLQRRPLTKLVGRLLASHHAIEIETNGRHLPLDFPGAEGLVSYNVSPKLSSSGEPYDRRIRPAVLRRFAETGAACFKFVCSGPDDLDEVEQIADLAGLDSSTIWISPMGTDVSKIVASQKALADSVVARRWNLSTRLHVLVWGDERGH